MRPFSQENFGNVWFSMIKTSVMMVGEFEYDDIFFDNIGAAANNEVMLPYPVFTIVFFLIFMCIMSIVVMNLLVGLAVDDIKAVQDGAVLQRLAMQVSLNLDVEKLLPDFIRRRMVIRQETVYPNVKKNILAKIFYDDNTLRRIARTVAEEENEVSCSVSCFVWAMFKRLLHFQSDTQKLTRRQEEILLKLRTVKDSIKGLNEDLEEIKRAVRSRSGGGGRRNKKGGGQDDYTD